MDAARKRPPGAPWRGNTSSAAEAAATKEPWQPAPAAAGWQSRPGLEHCRNVERRSAAPRCQLEAEQRIAACRTMILRMWRCTWWPSSCARTASISSSVNFSSSVSERIMRRVLPRPISAALAFLLFSLSFHSKTPFTRVPARSHSQQTLAQGRDSRAART